MTSSSLQLLFMNTKILVIFSLQVVDCLYALGGLVSSNGMLVKSLREALLVGILWAFSKHLEINRNSLCVGDPSLWFQ